MITKYKYPRTPHLPFSEGATPDDKMLTSDEHFKDKEVVISYKMDGENTTIYANGNYHARSLDSKHKEYHSWLLSYIPRWSYMVPEDHRICGEYLYAEHSIPYDNLESYFEVFSIWKDKTCLSWTETNDMITKLGLVSVPVIYIGKYKSVMVKEIAKEAVGNGQEGIVVRLADSFDIDNFNISIAKYVRKDHVQTDEHWSTDIIKTNRLKL